jgi:hypothetical protein
MDSALNSLIQTKEQKMNPMIFVHKMREVRSFLNIVIGKITMNNKKRIKAATEALKEIEKERQLYEKELLKALSARDKHRKKTIVDIEIDVVQNEKPSAFQEKVQRESPFRDISAI